MGKYEHLDLEKIPQSRNEKVLEAKNAIGKLPPGKLCEKYRLFRIAKDAIAEDLSDINLQIEAISELLREAYEAAGIRSLKLVSGGSIGIHPEPKAQVIEKETYRLWCLKQGLESQLALVWATTNSITKNLLLAGQPEPDGVKAYMLYKISYRRG